MGFWKNSAEESFCVDKLDIEQLASVIRESGYKALIEQDNNKESYVSSAQQGWDTAAYILNQGKSIQFSLLLGNNQEDLSLAMVNDFNVKWRYAKLMLNSERHTVILVMDVDLDGGVSQLYLAKRVALWDHMLGAFRRYVTEALNQTAGA